MATFSVGFLGCKVSHVDAHAVRERLLADGHSERAGGADVAVVSTCCVTHEAVSKSRKAVSRLARTHGRVYVTGCAANLPENAFAGLADNVVVVAKPSEDTPAAVAGDVGAIACVQAEARLDRVRAFVKVQDGCSFSCAFCVIPHVRGASRSRPADGVLREIARRVRAGPPRGRPHRHQPRLLPGSRRGLRPAAARARGRRHARPGAAPPLVDRGEPRERGARRGASRDAHGGPAPPHPAAVGRRSDSRGHGEALRRGDVPAPGRPRRRLQPHDRRHRRLSRRGRGGLPQHAERRRRGRDHEGARLSVLAAARAREPPTPTP